MIHHPNVGVLPCFPWIGYSLLFSPSRALLSFQSPLPRFSQHVCSPKSKCSVRSRNPFSRKQKNRKIEFYRSEGKLYLQKGPHKNLFVRQLSGLAAQDLFCCCSYICWKQLYAPKALTSTVKRFNGLSAHFGVTDFFTTTDFSGREKHCNVRTQHSQRSRWEYSFHRLRLMNTQAVREGKKIKEKFWDVL